MPTLQEIIVQHAPSEYNTADVQPDLGPDRHVYSTPEWEEPFEWDIDGRMVSIQKAIVVPVMLTDNVGKTTKDYLVVGYAGAGGS